MKCNWFLCIEYFLNQMLWCSQIIKDPDCGNPVDKLRIFLIMYLCSTNMTEVEFNDYTTALTEAGADTKALLYMKRWKSLMKVNFFFS